MSASMVESTIGIPLPIHLHPSFELPEGFRYKYVRKTRAGQDVWDIGPDRSLCVQAQLVEDEWGQAGAQCHSKVPDVQLEETGWILGCPLGSFLIAYRIL